MKKINKFVVAGLVAGLCVAVAFGIVGIDALGTPTRYEMTFTKLEFHVKGGAWVTVNETPVVVDLASVDPNTLAGAMTGGAVEYGTYDGYRSTVSMDITIQGAVLDGGNIYYTTENVVAVDGPNPGDLPGTGCVPGVMAWAGTLQDWLDDVEDGTIVVADYAACTIHPPTTEDTYTVEVMDDEFTVQEGDNIEGTLVVDVSDSIQLLQIGADPATDLRLFPAPPSIQFED